MFFIFGVSQGKKELNYERTINLNNDGCFLIPKVYMIYTYFSLFFIPIIKWNKKYFVELETENIIYQLDDRIGYEISKGNEPEIKSEHLIDLHEDNSWRNNLKTCKVCNFQSYEDYQYCPKCGHKL